MSEFKASGFRDEFGSGGPDLVGITTMTSPYYFVPPSGTTAERPSSPPPGMLRFNTDIGRLEVWRNDHWATILGESPNLGDQNQTNSAGGTGTRGLFLGGFAPGPITYDVVDYITISTLGNAQDFGDFTAGTRFGAACSSSTRALYGGGLNPGVTATIEFFTISSTGDATDFGDLTDSRQGNSAGSSSTRGIWTGGYDPTTKDVIDYVTMASTGDAVDFGNLSTSRKQQLGTACSSVRCVQGGSEGGASDSDVLDYITTSTLGNAQDFGDLTSGGDSAGNDGGCSNSTRGLFKYARQGPASVNNIDFITIASTGNAQDFGDVSTGTGGGAALSSPTRGVFAAGTPSGDDMTFATIATTGNTVDFGELSVSRSQMSGASNGHGGL